MLKHLWPCTLCPVSKDGTCSSGRLCCWYSSSVDKQKDLILEADKQTAFIRTKTDTFQGNMQLPLIPIRKSPFDFSFRKRSVYALQNSIAAKNHSPFRQAKPRLTICGIIYLRHISECQWNHNFTSHFLKKGIRKKLLLQKIKCNSTLFAPLLPTLEKMGGITGIKGNIKPNRKYTPNLHATTAISKTTNCNKIWEA